MNHCSHWLSLLLLIVAMPLMADDIPKSPAPCDSLRLVPDHAIAFFHCAQPKIVVEQLLNYAKRLELNKFDEVQELLHSTPYQRFYSFLHYLEKEYVRPWNKLLDDLTGQGLTIALLPDKDKKQPQVLGIIEAKDSSLLAKIYSASLDVIKQEAQNSDEPTQSKSKPYRNINVTSLGDKFFLAQHQQSLLLATHRDAMTGAIDQLLDAKRPTIRQHPRFVAAERPDSADVLAWGWIDLAYLKGQAKEEIDKIKLPTNDLLPQLLFGGLFDAVVRSDHAWFSLRHSPGGPRFEITTPTGRSAGQEGARMLHMHDPDKAPILPLLNPPGTLYSNSFYWDLSALWNDRTKLFKEGALKDFENSDKSVKPFLAGNSLASIFTTLGARHRIVVARQRSTGYTARPKSPQPAFAFIAECRDAEKLSKIAALPLRTAGFFFSTQFSMKLMEETHDNCRIVTYRFSETDKNKGYDHGTVFNYSPSFVRVGNFFIVSSTRELCLDLIDELNSQARSTINVIDTADMRHRFSWEALGDALAAERPRIATELTLRHGGAVDRVDDQVAALLKLLDKLGTLDVTISHSPGFRLDIRTNYK